MLDNSHMYKYIQSVLMPFAYDKYLPLLPNNNERALREGSTTSRSYTLGINDVLEVLMISPAFNPTTEITSSHAMILSKVNPPASHDLDTRLGLASNVFTDPEPSDTAFYVIRGAGHITTTGLVRYEAANYAYSTILVRPPATIFASNPKQEGQLDKDQQLWMMILPQYTEKRSFTTSVYRPGVCIHTLVKISNISNTILTVTVGAPPLLVEKTDWSTTLPTRIVPHTPIGFVQHVLERLRSKYWMMIIDPLDIQEIKNKKNQIRQDIISAVDAMTQEWHSLFRNTSNYDLKKLTNFIIFYLE